MQQLVNIVAVIVFLVAVAVAVLTITTAKPNIYNMPNQIWLERAGAVQGGVYVFYNKDCTDFVDVFGTCFNNNAEAPYIIPQPPVMGAYNDPDYALKCDPCQGTTAGGKPTNIAYRLTDQQAMITVLTYPPRSAYFGFLSYVFTRDKQYYKNIVSPELRDESPDSSRWELFASVGNSINNTVVEKQLLDSPWGKQFVLITTSNPNLADKLISLAVADGVSRYRIFVEQLGENVQTGDTRNGDDLLSLIRYAVPENPADQIDWTNEINDNVKVYKVWDKTIEVARYGRNEYTARNAHSERALQDPLTELAGLLLTSGSTMKTFKKTTVDIVGEPHGLIGADCIAKGTICAGDNADTSTYFFSDKFLQGASPTWMAGVNHNVLGNSSYISISVYNTTEGAGVGGLSQTNPTATGFNSGSLDNSAEAVLTELGLMSQASSSLIGALPQLYIASVQNGCSVALATCVDINGLIPDGVEINIEERPYIKPKTSTGANSNVVLNPILIGAGLQ